jgi:RHS repeat-associated protein
MAMAVTYSHFGGQFMHENRGGVETDFVLDTNGSVIATLDSNGNQTSSAEYWPFGEVSTSTRSNPSPLGYVGGFGYYSDSANHIYVQKRTYQPSTASWLSAVTARRQLQGEAAYGYARNDPLRFMDPDGGKPVVFPGGIEQMSNNFGECAVYICAEYTFGGIISGIPTHKYICVTGPYGGCSGGLYPAGSGWGSGWGGGKIGNRDKPCSGDPATNDSCQKIITGCDAAIGACACVKQSYSKPGDYIFPLRTCYTYPWEMAECACKNVKDPLAKLHCIMKAKDVSGAPIVA